MTLHSVSASFSTFSCFKLYEVLAFENLTIVEAFSSLHVCLTLFFIFCSFLFLLLCVGYVTTDDGE